MTEQQKEKYAPIDELKKHIAKLNGQKFRLDCGHHVTIGHNLANNIMIYNGKKVDIICSCCSY